MAELKAIVVETMMKRIPTALLCLSILGCAGPAFKEAAQRDSIVAYKEFVEIYPEGKYSERSRERIEELSYTEMRFRDNIIDYRAILEKYPKTKFASEINTHIVFLEALKFIPLHEYDYLLYNIIEEAKPVTKPLQVSLLNRTGFPLEILLLSREIFSFELLPNQKKTVALRSNAMIVIKDKKRAFKAKSYAVDMDRKAEDLEFWLAPEGKYSKKIEVVVNQKRSK